MALDEGRVNTILGEALGLAGKIAPGAEVQVRLHAGRAANTRFARNEITSTGDVDEIQVAITVAFGRRHAQATTNQTDPDSLRRAIDSAARVARIAPESPEHMPVLPAQRYQRSPLAFDAATDRLQAPVRARAAQAAIAAAEDAGLVAAGYYEHDTQVLGLATSAGLRAYHLQTVARFTTTCRTADGTGSGWAGALSHRAGEVDPVALARVAADKARGSARPRKLPPGRYTVVLEPAAVAELLLFLSFSLAARPADEGRSYFSRPGGGNRIGEKLFGEAVTLRTDPFAADTPAAPFDHDGLPQRATSWIDRGTLTGLIYSRYWAQKQGKPPTAFPTTLHLLPGKTPSDELVKGVKRGLLVTRFWYSRMVDPQTLLVTGLTRDGVFLIEDGQITAPVNNFRFNESPVTMLRNTDALADRSVRVPLGGGRLRVPALRTHEFNMASVSEAV
jgi:predicted Zn-dependent protease